MALEKWTWGSLFQATDHVQYARGLAKLGCQVTTGYAESVEAAVKRTWGSSSQIWCAAGIVGELAGRHHLPYIDDGICVEVPNWGDQ